MVVYEANFLYCRYSPAADILAMFSGRGISRFQRWPEAVAEHPVSHASSFYYPYRDPHSYRNSRKTSEASAPVWSHVFGISPSGAYALLLGLLCGYPMGTKITSDLIWLRQDQPKGSGISSYLYQSCQSCFYLYISDSYLSQ